MNEKLDLIASKVFFNSEIVWKANIAVLIIKQRHRIQKNWVAKGLGPEPEVFENQRTGRNMVGSEQAGKHFFNNKITF